MTKYGEGGTTREEFNRLCRGLAEMQRAAGKGIVVLVNEQRNTRQALEEAGVCVIPVGELVGELTLAPNGQGGGADQHDLKGCVFCTFAPDCTIICQNLASFRG